MPEQIVIKFEGRFAKGLKQAFIGWFMDGGGSDGLWETCNDRFDFPFDIDDTTYQGEKIIVRDSIDPELLKEWDKK